MRDLMSRQLFDVVIQAAANNKIVARETLKVGRPGQLDNCDRWWMDRALHAAKLECSVVVCWCAACSHY
jgi:hypothetical protein